MSESADLNLPPKLNEILETLDLFPDRADRIQALISFAERFEPVPESIAPKPYPEARRVKACESEAIGLFAGMPLVFAETCNGASRSRRFVRTRTAPS